MVNVNYRAITHYVGRVLQLETAFMLIPLGISIYEKEFDVAAGFGLTIAIMLALGLVPLFVKRGTKNITPKDGFSLVAICWILISAFGALPYMFSGEFPSYIDCFFESVSGFTTTGATVLNDIEALNKGLLFWRSFTHWIGGMGVLVFVLAIAPGITDDNTINVMRAESPGPSPGKLVPNLRKSAKLLYTIYITLTATQVVLYLFGGMPLFDSVCAAFSTSGTGGFMIWNDSMAHYNSVYIEVVATVFMVLCGTNFSLFHFILLRNFKSVLASEELKVYFWIIAISTATVTANLMSILDYSFGEALRQSAFNVAATISTTGYATCDTNVWPMVSKSILFLLMFIGSCAGSTGGGLKVSRIIILFKETRRILFRMSHPRSFEVVKLNGKAVDKTIVHGVSSYFVVFWLICGISIILISIDNYDFATTLTSVICSVNNIGPGFGLVGSTGNYEMFSNFSKIVLCFDMFVGRLEIYPILLLFAPHTWSKL